MVVGRCRMSARAAPSGSTGRPAKRVSTVALVRSPKSAEVEIGKPFRVPKPTLQPTNGAALFDAKAFLAKAGPGKKILSLKKNDTAYARGDLTAAIYYVQKGRLRVTVTSA